MVSVHFFPLIIFGKIIFSFFSNTSNLEYCISSILIGSLNPGYQFFYRVAHMETDIVPSVTRKFER